MLREIVLSAAVMIFGAEAAQSACPGQTGKSIFADDFSDDSGGWDVDAQETYVPGALQIKVGPKTKTGTGSYNQTFSAVNADYCTVIVFPPDQPEQGVIDFATIFFLATDYQNRYQISVYSDGSVFISRTQAGNWQTLLNNTKVPSVNTMPGAENMLRVVVKDQKMTFFINSTQIKVLRAQTPDAANKFGFFAGVVGKLPAKERVYTIKSFSVTEAP